MNVIQNMSLICFCKLKLMILCYIKYKFIILKFERRDILRDTNEASDTVEIIKNLSKQSI